MAIIFLAFGTWFIINRTTFGKEKIFEYAGDKYYKGFSSIYYRDFEYLIDLGWGFKYIPLVNKIDGADSESFVGIRGTASSGSPYLKDKNAIYYNGKKLEGIDAASFEVLNYPSSDINIYAKDINHVYLVYDSGVSIVGVVADPRTFNFIRESSIAKDSRNIYYYEGETSRNDRSLKIIAGADLASFVSLGHNFYKDNTNIYYRGKKIETADYQTFDTTTLAWKGYFRDKNYVYYDLIESEGIVFGADPNTFHQIQSGDSRYARDSLFEDKNYMYEFGRRVSK